VLQPFSSVRPFAACTSGVHGVHLFFVKDSGQQRLCAFCPILLFYAQNGAFVKQKPPKKGGFSRFLFSGLAAGGIGSFFIGESPLRRAGLSVLAAIVRLLIKNAL